MTFGNKTPCMVTWAKFLDKTNGQMFYHMNTHLDYLCEEERIREAELIAEKVKELQLDFPVFLTGDFNLDVQTKPFDILTKKGSFIDTWDLVANLINKNYGKMNDFKYVNGGDRRIDWILVRGSIK
ncbi:hypothetical protein J6TS2_25450 [Heyndrickxia sporothermodurans]|nr:hypothetical protein J6TS2_25450 [Heyndrickxia sporothermodurans]